MTSYKEFFQTQFKRQPYHTENSLRMKELFEPNEVHHLPEYTCCTHTTDEEEDTYRYQS